MKLLSNLRKDKKGFTLIEVVIVLAIAALILVIVFLAIGGAQRSQRDQASKDAAGKALAAYSSALSDSITIPASSCTVGTTAAGTAGTCTVPFQNYFKGVRDGRGSLLNWSSTSVPTGAGQATIIKNEYKCATSSTITAATGVNNVIVAYFSETANSAVCVDNQ